MRTETLEIGAPHGETTALLMMPDGVKGSAAAVVLIHEWWGINENIRNIARCYSDEGFVCIAPDLFRGKTAGNPQEAGELMNGLAMDDGLDTIRSTIAEAQRVHNIERFAITGFCMGGTFALRAACEIDALKAAAPFYGDIPDEQTLRGLRVPVLFIAAAQDKWITPEKVAGLEDAARKHDLPVQIKSYDADHAFFNDTRPEVYDPRAATDAWQHVLKFFRGKT